MNPILAIFIAVGIVCAIRWLSHPPAEVRDTEANQIGVANKARAVSRHRTSPSV